MENEDGGNLGGGKVKRTLSLRKSRFEHFFLQYGAGSQIFLPLARWRFWNRFCWILIALGVIGWVVGMWVLQDYLE